MAFLKMYLFISSLFLLLLQMATLESTTTTSQVLVNFTEKSESIQMEPSEMENIPMNQTQLEFLLAQFDQSISSYRYEQISYAIAYSIIILLSLFGNFLVVKVCIQNLTKTNVLILSLALSDLIMSICNIPFNYIRLLNYSWPFGSVMCFLVNFVKHLAVYNSSYTMALIAIQRYYSVCVRPSSGSSLLSRLFTPQNARKLAPLRAINTMVVLIWIISALISTLFTYTSTVVSRQNIYAVIKALYIRQQALAFNLTSNTGEDPSTEEDTESLTMYRCTNPLPESVELYAKKQNIKADFVLSLVVFGTQYFIPLSIACVLYIRIGKAIALQGRLATLKQNSKAQIRERKKRRRILMLILVVASFSICWAPIHLFHILVDARLVEYNYQVFMAVHWLAMSSVMYNPFIYCWLNDSFRKAAIRIFCCCRHCSSSSSSSSSSSRSSNNVPQPPTSLQLTATQTTRQSRQFCTKRSCDSGDSVGSEVTVINEIPTNETNMLQIKSNLNGEEDHIQMETHL